MAISTLSKFTVPLANDQSSASQGLLMPKLQYRFRAILENFGVSTPRSELTKQVMDITRPNLTFDQVTLDVYNSRVYVAGKHTWEPITVTLRDDVNNSVSKLVGEQIQKQFDFFEQSSAAFELYGAYIDNVNYNTLAYNVSDPATITLSIRYDNAVQTPQGTGIGTAVTRTIGTLSTGGGQ